jgi:pilus assembly protein Flp/PilA
MLKIQVFIHKLMNPLANKEGATAVEYGIMVALIAAVIIGTVQLLGQTLDGVFSGVNDQLGPVAP